MAMSGRLPFEAITEQPWALLRSTLQHVVEVASSDTPIQAASRAPLQTTRAGVISVVPIHGVIEHRPSFIGELLGGTSVQGIRASLQAAIADPDVMAIVLDVDSPGGGVTGITELASEIRKARETKPIVAVANGTAASAAYWLAAQAERVYATPSGQVGSIGVYAVHIDISKALDAEGVKPTIISAGDHKTEGNEFEPLSDDAQAHLKSLVDATYDRFVGDVAKGRGTTAAEVTAGYGAGRVLDASRALEAGLVDEVGTLEDAIRQVARSIRSTSAIRGEREDATETLPFSQRVHDQASDMAALVAHAKVRADLRAREGRPSFSSDIEAELRSIRADALELTALLSVDPAPASATPAVDPPPVAIPIRFQSRSDWLDYLEAHSR